MFTGLIESLGSIGGISVTKEGAVINIEAPDIVDELAIGDSVATNGVCLTVTRKTSKGFMSDVMPVTLSSSNLGSLKTGACVNIERAMTLKDRLDGHMVTGHVDAIGKISSISNEGNAILYRISLDRDITARMILKGSVAIDGISLTIQDLVDGEIEVSIIPHTAEVTRLRDVGIGDLVNVETDVIGKYVERLLGIKKDESTVDMGLLSRCGFL